MDQYHSTADYEFDGAITGDFATASAPSLNTVRNLTINNAAGVLLSTSNNNLTVTGALNLTSGLFTIPTTDTLTIAGTVPSPSGTIDASTGATSAVVLKNTGFTLNASIFNPAGTIRNLINNPASGTNTLSGNFTITNTLGLTSGVLDNSGNRLTFQTGNIPIVRTAGTLTVNNTSSLIFGTAGNLGGNAFTIPNAMFTTAPSIKTFIINRSNSITFGNQPFTINDSLVLTAGVLNNGNDSLTFQNGNVPISRTSGTLTMGTTATLIFGTAGNTAGNAFTIPNSVFTSAPSISNFAMNRANTLTLGNQSLTLSNTLTITSGTLDANTQTLNGTANVTMTGGTLSLAKNGVKLPELTGTYNLTGGTVNIYGSGTGASADTIRAVNYFNLSSGSTGDRVLSSTQVTGIAGTFTPSTNTYVITGSHVDFNGTATQNIPAFSFDTLSFSSVSGTPSKTLAGNVNIKSTLNLKNSIQLNLSNSFLNLNSTAGKTARISTVSSGVGVSYSGSGRFVIERYYPARRAWHLTTAPVTADAGRSLFSSWQIGGASTSGSGTYITSPTPNAGNGLDASPQNNYSLKQYINGTQSFLNIDSTKTRNIAGTTGVAGTPDNLVYFLFVRGDRTPANLVPPTCNSTTIRDTGKIQYNTQTFTTSSTLGNFTAIGNPYASPVDFNSITLNNSLRKFWAWDPTLNDVGGYVLVDGISGSYVTSPAVGTSITKNIQSSQGIFVQTTSAGTPSVVFSESNKNDSNNLAIFRTQGSPVPSMVANLYKNDNGSLHFADGTLAQFDDNWSGDVDFYDGIKFGNVNEQFSLYRNNKSLAIERRPLVQICDTLFFKLTKTTQRLYSLEISFSDFNLTALKGVLVDKFTGTHTDLNLQGSENIDFAVTSDPASASADRFYIVFKSSNPLPVTISSIRAWKQNQSGIVEWKVENELSMAGYELQKSTDGIHFNDVQLFLPAGNGVGKTYQWEDVNLQTGYNYYRVESKGQNGTVNYSEVVKILNSKISSHSIVLFPNPSNGTTIGVQFNEWPEGVYSLRCMNALGQLVKETTVIHHGGSSVYTLKPAKTLAKGIYQIEIVGEDGTQQVIPLVVE